MVLYEDARNKFEYNCLSLTMESRDTAIGLFAAEEGSVRLVTPPVVENMCSLSIGTPTG